MISLYLCEKSVLVLLLWIETNQKKEQFKYYISDKEAALVASDSITENVYWTLKTQNEEE